MHLRIIHYISSLRFGGIERLVYDLVSQQTKRQSLDIGIGIGKSKGEFKAQFEGLGVDLINFNLNSGFDLNPSKISKISKHFKTFDVIHLHGFHLSIALAALLSRKKIIYTEHGNFGFGRQIKGSDKLSFFLRQLFFRYTKTIICCNSNFTKDYVESNFYKGKRLNLVYNGSNLKNSVNENLKRDLLQKYDNKFVIGTSTRLAGFKKVNRLILLFSDYIKENSNALLVIVGDGIERQNLEMQVSELKIGEHVVFEGFQKEVATYQSVFDVCVFPSLNEPFGLVAVECFSKRKPVLVFKDGGGITEIVNRFQPEDICADPKAMINRFKYYSDNAFEWREVYEEQLEFFSLERMEQDYYNQYKKII